MTNIFLVAGFLIIWFGTAYWLDRHVRSFECWPYIGIALQLIGFVLLFVLINQ